MKTTALFRPRRCV